METPCMVLELPRDEGVAVPFSFVFEEQSLGVTSPYALALHRVEVNGKLVLLSGVYGLVWSVRANIEADCSRCLEPVEYTLQFEESTTLYFEEDTPLDEVESETLGIRHDALDFDLMPYLQESITLHLPMRIYHGMEGTQEQRCNGRMLSFFSDAEEGEEDKLTYRLKDTPFARLLQDALKDS